MEIAIVCGILWLYVCFQLYRVHRKFQELKRKSQLQLEKGDPTVQEKKTHENIEIAIR